MDGGAGVQGVEVVVVVGSRGACAGMGGEEVSGVC